MTDIATVWVGTNGDFKLVGADLAAGNDLTSALLISLFTDRTIDPDVGSPDGTGDPRGWWADDPQRPIGSNLWLLHRAKRVQETLSQAQGFAEEALRWMVDDRVAAAVNVRAEWVDPSQLSMQVTVRYANGTSSAVRFLWAWADLLKPVNV